MDDLLPLISRHGYLLLAAVCFAEAIGLPLPASIALLTAGAVAAYGKLHLYSVLGIGLVTMLTGDLILYFTGRVSGWALLGFLCRLSANPETCILRSAEYFYRRGKQTLLFAKFIPGINTMSPPLAGSMKMRLGDFLAIRFARRAVLRRRLFAMGGYVFSDACGRSREEFAPRALRPKSFSELGLAAYIVYRIWIYRKYRLLDAVRACRWKQLARACNPATDGTSSSPTSAVTDTTTPTPNALRDRFASSPTIWRKRSRVSRAIRRFISTVLDNAKPRAPGWRIYSRNMDSRPSSSSADCAPGARPDSRSNRSRTTISSSCQHSVECHPWQRRSGFAIFGSWDDL